MAFKKTRVSKSFETHTFVIKIMQQLLISVITETSFKDY
jgi:hypothetical protein